MALITNIIKKIRDAGFVRFIDGNLLDKDDNIIDSIEGGGGADGGQIMVPVPAYASAPDGSGFTLTSSDTLEYMGWAVLPLGQTPVVNDYAGKWFHRKGLPGQPGTPTNGVDGQSAGFRINWDTSTVEEKPGTGKIRANNANPSLATELYIDEMMPNAVDISAVINFMKDGMMFMIRPSGNSSTPIFIYELTADPVDNGDWFTLPVTNLAASATTYLNNDPLTFQFFGGGGVGGAVTETAIITAGNFVRHASNGAGGYKLIDINNVEIKAAAQTFKFSGFTISGVPNLPAANTFPHGAVVRIHQDCFVGAGASAFGIYLQADAVNNKWRSFGHQVMFWKEFSSVGSPTLTLTAAGKYDLGAGGDPVIPAGLLSSDSRIRVYMTYRKVGTTQPVVRANLGTDLSARENNSIVYTQTVSATDNFDVPGESLISFLSSTTARCSNRSARGGSGGGGAVIDASTLLNTASDMKLTLEASTVGASTSIHLLSYGLAMEF